MILHMNLGFTSIRFLAAGELQRLRRLFLLDDYLRRKQEEIDSWNQKLALHGNEPANTRCITNLGTFRASTGWKTCEAILPEFGLRVFQHLSGVDWREGLDRRAAAYASA